MQLCLSLTYVLAFITIDHLSRPDLRRRIWLWCRDLIPLACTRRRRGESALPPGIGPCGRAFSPLLVGGVS